MPTECEHTINNTQQQIVSQTEQQQQQQQQENEQLLPTAENLQANSGEEETGGAVQPEFTYDDMEAKELNDSKMSTSQTSTTSQTTTTSSTNGHNGGNNTNGVCKKTSIISPDPTPYVTKARVTRPTPPPPPYNPMQFVQIKPCNLYQTAQEQLKKAEEVKKIKEIKKEDPEDWQNNLDNWKSSRRKRVEHIIDRVVEVKKLELEEHDRTRRKSKTFSEMIEERGERGGRGRAKLATLAVYNEDESNDLSDLGIGTSSASGKSSQSEDYDNNSVLSDNAELDKAIHENNQKPSSLPAREYISSPGYDTSSSTAPGSSPDPCEYTYEGAIQDYKQRVSRASGGSVLANYKNKTNSKTNSSKETITECNNTTNNDTYPTRRGSKIEDRLMGFEVTSPSDSQEGLEKKVDVPKIDISKRKEIFENHNTNTEPKSLGNIGAGTGNHVVPRVTLRDRFKLDESANGNGEVRDSTLKREVKRLSGDITSVRSRMQSLEQQQNLVNSINGGNGGSKLVDMPVPPLKERLSSLQNAVTKEEIKKAPVALVDARQLEIMKNEEEQHKKQIEHEKREQVEQTKNKAIEVNTPTPLEATTSTQEPVVVKIDAPEEEVDRDDSGIHTADGETDTGISEQEQQLNAAIAALALEEQQLTEAANAVNQIEAEFDELSTSAVNAIANDLAAAAANTATKTTNEQPCEMEFSVSSTNPNKTMLQPNSSISSVKSSTSFEKEDNRIDINSSSRSISCIGDKVANNDDKQILTQTEQEVLGKNTLNIASTSSLQRKPSNEMVHARNLLRMFKETFKSDIELDEAQEQEVKEIELQPSNTGAIPKTRTINPNAPPLLPKPLLSQSGADIVRAQTPQHNNPISTQIFQSSAMTPSPLPSSSPLPYTQQHDTSPIAIPPKPSAATRAPTPPPRSSPSVILSNGGLSMIPRAINPIGKPPMSPKSTRYIFSMKSPVNSPPPARKPTSGTAASANNNPFSINGRVEIFNSKNMSSTTTPIGKPPTPTLSARKSYVPHLSGATTPPTSPLLPRSPSPMNAMHGNGVGLPKQQQKQQRYLATVTALPATADVLPTSSNQMSQTTTENVVAEAAESMPSVQAVSEPSHETQQRVLNMTAGLPHTPQQQQQRELQQQQHTEVVMCAPPITILNLDELPKPNTVKALSSCFSQDGKTVAPPLPGPKPLPRSRIPQQTPPQSPTPAKRNSPSAPITNKNAATAKEFTQPTITNKGPEQQTHTQIAVELANMTASSTSSIDLTTDAVDLKKLSIISDTSTMSSDCSTNTGPFEITALVHTPPVMVADKSQELQRATLKPLPLARQAPVLPNKPTAPAVRPTGDPLEPNDSLTPLISEPSEMPTLVACKPNASTLFKLTTPPASPHSPRTPLSPTDVTLCSNFLDSFEHTNSFLPTRQKPVAESPCDKMNINDLPPNKRPPCTYYKDISAGKVSECDASGKETVAVNVSNSKPPQTQRQHTVEEKVCQKIDINKLPPFDQVPLTGYDEVTAEQVRRCDGLNSKPPNKVSAANTSITTNNPPNTPTKCTSTISFFPTNNTKSNTPRPNSKPNSPIMATRAAHSRALIDTCERIIAEERLHSSQMKSALPANVPTKSTGTPLLQRKSKIPKPIPCCISGSDSMNQADQQGKPVLTQLNSADGPPTQESVDENMVIGRLHVVETQIKVTTTTPPTPPTPPTSPPATPKASKKVGGTQTNTKKTKNIFDFLRRNFGLGDDHASSSVVEDAPKAAITPRAVSTAPSAEKYTLKTDEIISVDNSKFYIPTDDTTVETMPPPLPKTPAPVNIEITKTFTTDEIVQGGTSEQALVEEINEMLDDELNKLTLETGSSVSGGSSDTGGK